MDFKDGLSKEKNQKESLENIKLKDVDFIEELKKYKEEYGNLLVPTKYKTKEGYALGHKVANIRRGAIKLNAKQEAELVEMGFVMDAQEYVREVIIEELRKYKEENGNLLVPQKYVTKEGYLLGQKVASIRSGNIKLNAEQYVKLKEMGFVRQMPRNKVEVYILHAKAYLKRNGNLDVDEDFVEPAGYEFGRMTHCIKQGEFETTEKQIQQLKELGIEIISNSKTRKRVQDKEVLKD